jgi:hypothetical protein
MLTHNPRVIQLDEAVLHELVEDLTAEFVDAVRDSSLRFKPRSVILHDVAGREKRIKVGLKRVTKRHYYRETIHGGMFDRSKKLVSLSAHVPSLARKLSLATDPQVVFDGVAKEIRSVLVHELTHVRDYLDSAKAERSRGRGAPFVSSAYINAPHEVRAFGREIAEAVAEAVRRGDLDRSKPIGPEIARLAHKEGHPHHYYMMRDENKRRVLQLVTRYLDDLGLIEA